MIKIRTVDIGEMDLARAEMLDDVVAKVPLTNGDFVVVGKSRLTGLLVRQGLEYLVEVGECYFDEITDEIILTEQEHDLIFANLV